MNALAHCAEALYVQGRSDAGDVRALEGAELIAGVAARGRGSAARCRSADRLLRGARFAGEALALAGLGLAHAMAQALGGTYGLPHGAMNALTPAACAALQRRRSRPMPLRGLAPRSAPEATRRRVEELARLGGFERLRRLRHAERAICRGSPVSAAQRPGNQMNPRPATPAEIEELLRSIY